MGSSRTAVLLGTVLLGASCRKGFDYYTGTAEISLETDQGLLSWTIEPMSADRMSALLDASASASAMFDTAGGPSQSELVGALYGRAHSGGNQAECVRVIAPVDELGGTGSILRVSVAYAPGATCGEGTGTGFQVEWHPGRGAQPGFDEWRGGMADADPWLRSWDPETLSGSTTVTPSWVDPRGLAVSEGFGAVTLTAAFDEDTKIFVKTPRHVDLSLVPEVQL